MVFRWTEVQLPPLKRGAPTERQRQRRWREASATKGKGNGNGNGDGNGNGQRQNLHPCKWRKDGAPAKATPTTTAKATSKTRARPTRRQCGGQAQAIRKAKAKTPAGRPAYVGQI